MLDRFHKISENVASFAIVGSLIFVGVQVNQNTNATRVSNAQAAMQVWSDHCMAMATSESLAQAFLARFNPEIVEAAGLTLDDVRLNMWMSATVRSVESNYLEWLAGNVSDDLWLSHRQSLLSTYAVNEAMRSYWGNAAQNHSQPFQELMKEIMPEADLLLQQVLAFPTDSTN